ncbi:hypothetical protein EGT49_07160 [Companilactobacillus suantsaicola]|uniref:MucBP domain-containing protein n=1 Tax=Companilactobacillus suantsaicola TaxID=2487723 RepID=A0A4Z0JLU9_9LACO|nr:MucBP domain-containing protein [Companilactobacillus suantsaicola]TGD23107.1 hypothetical protein EGT49_07160 [Companilactobacillus suantsaicola]
MDFKKKCLNKALEDKIYRVKLVHGKKGWLAVGLTFITLFSASMFGQKVEASAVNNVAVANSAKSNYVQLWSDVTSSSIHKANRGLANGTAWKTAKAVKGYDGKTYILVGGNEYANANQMDLADETSKQDLSGVVLTNSQSRLYTNPLAANGPQLITNRGLGNNTAWKTDEKVVVNGQTYYRVATNEWIKSGNVTLTSESSRGTKDYTKNSPMAETVVDTNDNNNSGSTTTPTDPDKMVTITISYFHRSTTTNDHYVLKSETRRVKLGSKITIDAPEIAGYSVDPHNAHNTFTVLADNEEFAIPYTKDGETPTNPDKDGETNIVINYFHRSTYSANNYILKSEVRKAKLDSEITIDAPEIAGYTVVPGEEQQSYKVQLAGETFNVPYTKNVESDFSEFASCSTKFVNENGDEINQPLKYQAAIGTKVYDNALQLDGYELKGEATKSMTATRNGDNTITFVYKNNAAQQANKTANLNVVYADLKGNKIAKTKVIPNQKVGTYVTDEPISIEGYTLNSDPNTGVIINENGQSTILYAYRKDDGNKPGEGEAKVTVKYQDADGKSLKADKTVNSKIGTNFAMPAPSIDGYTVDRSSKSVLVKQSGSEITFVYTKKAPK